MTSPFIAAIETRLRQAGYDVSLNVELPAAAESGAWHGYVPVRAALVAARFYFCWKCFSYVSQNIFVAELPDAGAAQLDNLSAAGAAFSRQKHSPLSYLTAEEKSWSRMGPGGTAQRIKARGSYIVIPVVITKAPRPDILASCATKPRLTMPMFRLPVVIDADSGTFTITAAAPSGAAAFFPRCVQWCRNSSRLRSQSRQRWRDGTVGVRSFTLPWRGRVR
jgi:hypothetical protein